MTENALVQAHMKNDTKCEYIELWRPKFAKRHLILPTSISELQFRSPHGMKRKRPSSRCSSTLDYTRKETAHWRKGCCYEISMNAQVKKVIASEPPGLGSRPRKALAYCSSRPIGRAIYDRVAWRYRCMKNFARRLREKKKRASWDLWLHRNGSNSRPFSGISQFLPNFCTKNYRVRISSLHTCKI